MEGWRGLERVGDGIGDGIITVGVEEREMKMNI